MAADNRGCAAGRGRAADDDDRIWRRGGGWSMAATVADGRVAVGAPHGKGGEGRRRTSPARIRADPAAVAAVQQCIWYGVTRV
uniref:Uncharacterized protein n=1 Tax=Oryza sativa subsp. japonica TaxID=39947 RepID=Q6YS98_ORYSJ|nr:hypothetical protein [Oryza sativa Japonica Group]